MRVIDKNNNDDKGKQVYEYLVNRGLQPHHAIGVVGNLMQESGPRIDSSAVNPTSEALGIAQWLGPRKAKLKEYARSKNKPVTDFDTQLEFLHLEITDPSMGGWTRRQQEAFFNAKTVEEAAAMFHDKFERAGEKPGDPGYERRIKNAKNLYVKFNDEGLYGRNTQGQYVNLNPETATPDEIAMAPKIKDEFYKEVYGVATTKELASAQDTEQATAQDAQVSQAQDELSKAEVEKSAETTFIEQLMNPTQTRQGQDELEQILTQEAAAKAQREAEFNAQQLAVNRGVAENEFFGSFIPPELQ